MRAILFLLLASSPLSLVGQLNEAPITLTLTQPEKRVYHCRPGPWGNLDYYPITLEAPDHLVEMVPRPSARTVWSFPGLSVDQIRVVLKSALLSDIAIDQVLRESLPTQLGPSYHLYPSIELVEGMSPQSRSLLYAALRKWSVNRFHHSPVIIEDGNPHAWFSGSQLSPETIQRIESLCYRMGNSLAFSDVSAVLYRLTSDVEEFAFLKALTRTRSLMLRLRIDENTDTDALKSYWTMGLKSKDVLPYFDSITRTPGNDRVDLIHLLPPTARKYLNTFPTLALGMEGNFPGSFWTSLNFFRYQPASDFNDDVYAVSYTRSFYSPAEKPYTFGDLLLISLPDSPTPIHSCVYVADDIVYTKNGRSVMRPFMLMKINDLLSRYSTEGTPTISIWRHDNP